MVTAGIDVGIEATKIAVLKDDELIGKSIGFSGGARRAEAVSRLYAEALADAGVDAADVGRVIATGAGKYDVGFADSMVTEPVADAKAARFFLKEAVSAVDIGADQVRVISLGADGAIDEIALNQKCGAGIGTLLRYICRRLEMDFADMPCLTGSVAVNDGCVVFAELDALELLNKGVPKEEVAAAVVYAMAVRANMVLNDKTRPAKEGTVLLGGVSRNEAFVCALKERSGISFLVPDDAVFGGAIGAALLREKGDSHEEQVS